MAEQQTEAAKKLTRKVFEDWFAAWSSSGNRFRMRGASVIVLEGGKIHRYSSYWDTKSMTAKPFSE